MRNSFSSRTLRAGVVALGLWSCAWAAFAAGPPKLRLQEVQKVEPVSYRAELKLDPAQEAFQGTIRIKLMVAEPTQTIWLNASKLTFSSATLEAGGKNLTGKATPSGEDFVGIEFDAPVPQGASELTIQYSGQVKKDESAGIFRTDDKGHAYLLTQFESTDARDAFPCFDEPNYKVPWQLTVHVPPQDTAVSNTPVVSDKTNGADRTFVFAETKPLPSYLIAFGVGPFEYVDAGKACKKQVPVRIVVPKGRAAEAKYAAEVTATILTRLEEYFGVPYAYEKSDQVAVPLTTGFGAMENAGMVTYGQTIILADPASDTIGRQRGYATTAAHELAHQWFGDLVTTSWWNDIWLNEAFATWMEQKLIAEWKPEWKTRVDDVGAKLYAAGQDSLVSARQIRQPIENKGDIGAAFDGITYQKGAAVIGMFENWMGADHFRSGVQLYMKRYAFKTTTAGDFLDSLSSGGKNVTAAFSTFLNQPGVPLISVALDCNGPATLHLEQKRFLPIGSKGSTDQTWSAPVCVRYAGGSECTLMTQRTADLRLNKANGCPAWVQADDAAKGYYRVDYKGSLLNGLLGPDTAQQLSPAERANLIGNAGAVWSAGILPADDAFRMVERFHDDPERSVVEGALDLALTPDRDLVTESVRAQYQRFLTKNFDARARELGWKPRAGESDDMRLLRRGLVGAMAKEGGDEQLAREASELAKAWLQDRSAVSPDVRGAVLSAAAYNGDRALFDSFFAAYQKTENRQEAQSLLGALVGFRDKAVNEDALTFVPKGKVQLPDGLAFLFAPGTASAETRKMPFDALKPQYDELAKKSVFGFELASFLPRVGGGLCDAQSRSEYASFFEPRIAKTPSAARPYAQTLETIDLCIALKNAQESKVTAFLEKY